MRSKRTLLILAFIIILLFAFTGCISDEGNSASPVTTSKSPLPDSQPETDILPNGSISYFETTLKQIYSEVNPSVVHIRVVKKSTESYVFPDLPEFEFEFPEERREYYTEAQGSGFVWDSKGHIVTNNHVVSDADTIYVTFYDGTIIEGEVVGKDPDSDLAVLKVVSGREKLEPVQMGVSSQVEVGQLAVSIGNPFGLEGSMTVGFVSAIGRLLPVDSGATQSGRYNIPDVIQTDASINPGNSGGVLVDSGGRVIGVPSAIISPVGVSAGIGFAIPSNIVSMVVPELIETSHYEHPWLGISGRWLTPEIADAMDLPADQRGALVVDVIPDSPADKAGIQGSDRTVTIRGVDVRVGGDLIVAIDNEAVTDMGDIIAYLSRSTEVGQKVELTVIRGGEEKTLEVELGARPSSGDQANETGDTGGTAWLGITGMALTPDIAEAMNLSADQEGVLVVEVVNGSPADVAGLRGSYKPVTVNGRQILIGGDVITSINDSEVNDIKTLKSLIQRKSPGGEVTLKLLRNGEEIQSEVSLGEIP
ncbi:MAG: PDZ domain-containing protein [Dehalococcoidia bacterium]